MYRKRIQWSVRSSILVISFAISSVSAYCATTTYSEKYGHSEYCEKFFKAIKDSQLNSMTDKQICSALKAPTTKYLFGNDFKELAWENYPVNNPLTIAKHLYESQYRPFNGKDKNTTKRLVDSENIWLDEIAKNDYPGNIYARWSEVNLNHNTYYVLELNEKDCDFSYNKSGPLPIYAFFKDRKFQKPANMYLYKAGKLVYYNGRVSSFNYYLLSSTIDPNDQHITKTIRLAFISGYVAYKNDKIDISGGDANLECGLKITTLLKE